MISRIRLPLLNLGLASLTLLTAAFCTFPWCDELVLSDNPARWAVAGAFDGRVWPNVYNLLHPLLLSIFFRLFGVSHTTCIALSALAAFLTAGFCLRLAGRRRLFASDSAGAAFLLLFWGGWGLSWMVTDGRLDALTMLFTVLFADSLIPDAARTEDRRSLLQTGIAAAGLTLTSVYMLPVLFVLGVVLLVGAAQEDRRTLFRKGLVSAGAIILSYLAMLAWYVLLGEPVRFLGFYLYFNTLTGMKADPLPLRIFRGYLYNPEALVLALLTCVFVARDRHGISRRNLGFLVFAFAIPLFMTLGGRYEHYYSWAFYLPLTLAAVAMASRWRQGRRPVVLLAVGGAALLATNQLRLWSDSGDAREGQAKAEDFVRACAKDFTDGVEVVVATDVTGDAALFYPLLRTGARPWFRGADTLRAPSDREKFAQGLSFIVKDEIRRKQILDRVLRHQRCMPTLPDSGYVIFTGEENRREVGPLLRQLGLELREAFASGTFTVMKILSRSRPAESDEAEGRPQDVE